MKPRLTLEEIEEFNPSPDNPMACERESKFGTNSDTIQIITPKRDANNCIVFINDVGVYDEIDVDHLGDYLSLKQPKTRELWRWECLIYGRENLESTWCDTDGIGRLGDKSKRFLEASWKRKIESSKITVNEKGEVIG